MVGAAGAPPSRPAALERLIGVRSLALTAVNIIVGSGIFALPAIAATGLGPAAIIVYLVCAVVIGLVGLCFAEAGSRVSAPGGLYAYAGTAFGPLAASFVGTLLWFAHGVLSNAAVATILATTVGIAVPALRSPAGRTLFLVTVYLLLAGINIRGVRGGLRLSEALTVIKLTPLVLLLVAGVFAIDPANLRWTAVPSAGTIAQKSVVLFFAFIGFEGALSTSGEVKDPARTVPRGILLALTLTTALYLGLQLVTQGVLGARLPETGGAPLVETARLVFGGWGGTLFLVATGLSAAGFLAAEVFSSSRVFFALGRDGLLPGALGAIHPRFRTPAIAVGMYTGLAALFAVTGSFERLALLSSGGTLVIYLVCCLAVLRLRSRGVRGEAPPFVAPGGPATPLLAGGAILYLLLSLRGAELLAVGGVLAFSVVPYLMSRHKGPARPSDPRPAPLS